MQKASAPRKSSLLLLTEQVNHCQTFKWKYCFKEINFPYLMLKFVFCNRVNIGIPVIL